MLPTFITAKKRSQLNVNGFLAPLLGYWLLMMGQLATLVLSLPLSMFLPRTPTITLAIQLFSFIGISIAVIIWARTIEKSPWEGLGFVRQGAFRQFFIGCAVGAGMLIASALLMMAVGAASFEGITFSWPMLLKFLIIALAWTVQSSAEEILARGWLFSSLAARYSVGIGLIVSSLFFSALHLGNDGIALIPLVNLTLFGVLAALYMLKTDNIWGVSGIHAAWNCVQGSVFSFSVSGMPITDSFIKVSTQGPDWLSGGKFGVEGSIFSVLVQSAVIGWLIYDLYIKVFSACDFGDKRGFKRSPEQIPTVKATTAQQDATV